MRSLDVTCCRVLHFNIFQVDTSHPKLLEDVVFTNRTQEVGKGVPREVEFVEGIQDLSGRQRFVSLRRGL